jgi:hypothetical protein
MDMTILGISTPLIQNDPLDLVLEFLCLLLDYWG